MKNMNKEVIINGVKQNCYVRDVSLMAVQPIKGIKQKKYPSLERELLSNGFTEEIKIRDYPITAESVKSYADAANYRNDPAQAVANAPNRVNLGDITQVQDFVKNNPQDAVRVFRDVLSRLGKLQSSGSTKSNADNSPIQETNNKEV